MPARPNVIPSVDLHVMIPLDVKARMDLHLHSDMRNRVPKGAYQAFIVSLLREFFDRKPQ